MNDDVSQIILDELREHRRESNLRHEVIDKRVRKVESWQSDAGGKLTAFGVFCTTVGAVVAFLADFFRPH